MPNQTDESSLTLYQCATGDSINVKQCVKSGVLSFLCLITVIACIIKSVQLIRLKKSVISCHLIILYIAVIEMLLSLVHYSAVSGMIMDFTINFLKVCQYSVLVYFFTSFALILFNRTVLRKFLWPFLALALFSFVALLLVASYYALFATGTFTPCRNPAWLGFSILQCVLGTALSISGVFIVKKIRDSPPTSTKESMKVNEKQLLVLMFIFNITSVASLAYEIYIYASSDTPQKCYQFFAFMPAESVALFALVRIADILVPVWSVIFLFSRRKEPEKETLLVYYPPTTKFLNYKYEKIQDST